MRRGRWTCDVELWPIAGSGAQDHQAESGVAERNRDHGAVVENRSARQARHHNVSADHLRPRELDCRGVGRIDVVSVEDLVAVGNDVRFGDAEREDLGPVRC